MKVRVFMVGKKAEVMDRMAREMGPDFEVTHYDDVARARAAFDADKFDVVILGRALKQPDREAILGTVSGAEGVPVIDSIGPQGVLSAAHARAAISEAGPTAKVLRVTSASDKRVRFELTRDADVTVTFYGLTVMQRNLKVRPVFQGRLAAGTHQIDIPRTFSDRFTERKHLYVAADNGDARLIRLPGL